MRRVEGGRGPIARGWYSQGGVHLSNVTHT